MQDPGHGLQWRNTKPWPAGDAAPNRGPKEAQHQQPAARRRRITNSPWPAGCATLDRGPPVVQDQRVGNKDEGGCCASGGCQCAARVTGLGAAGASSVGAFNE